MTYWKSPLVVTLCLSIILPFSPALADEPALTATPEFALVEKLISLSVQAETAKASQVPALRDQVQQEMNSFLRSPDLSREALSRLVASLAFFQVVPGQKNLDEVERSLQESAQRLAPGFQNAAQATRGDSATAELLQRAHASLATEVSANAAALTGNQFNARPVIKYSLLTAGIIAVIIAAMLPLAGESQTGPAYIPSWGLPLGIAGAAAIVVSLFIKADKK